MSKQSTPVSTVASITTELLERCRSLGFALAGITHAEPSNFAEQLRDWLGRGEHGEMTYMERNLDVRLDPRELLPGARSIICVADRYAAGARDPRTAEPRGKIARYARGNDYHVVMKRRLHELCDALSEQFPDASFRACVDAAPLLEREFAARAGLGAVGKNTMLIARGSGSYLLLGEVLTTLELESSPSMAATDPCATCTRCIDACPTDAITPWNVNANKCISYLTIEHRSPIDEQFHERMGDWIFGCDICQEVCPHNQPTRRKRRVNAVHPEYEPRRRDFDLLEVLGWDEHARSDAFLKSSMKRAKLAMMKRNALIAAGNWIMSYRDDAAMVQAVTGLHRRIEEIARDAVEDGMVRETATAVVRRLSGTGPC